LTARDIFAANASKSIIEIVQEIIRTANGTAMSARKDAIATTARSKK
jgi:tryptophanase